MFKVNKTPISMFILGFQFVFELLDHAPPLQHFTNTLYAEITTHQSDA
jgi:hypothetical protein